MTNPLLDLYHEMLDHQRSHGALITYPGDQEQPDLICHNCPRAAGRHDVHRRYSWAIPNDEALEIIAKCAPTGVVEIGAGGGYWAHLLRGRGVDVIAYDPEPDATGDGRHTHQWSEVLLGDHAAVTGHPDRALLLVWPSYDQPWTHEVVDLYDGDTVIYVGEGPGGCTGTDRMHALLGEPPYCWHGAGDECDCAEQPGARFAEVAAAEIPQWFGLHDQLRVYKRL